MAIYKVRWDAEIEADSPEEAARMAYAMLVNGEDMDEDAAHFRLTPDDGGRAVVIEFGELDDEDDDTGDDD
jgi:hypothetical protein